MKRLLIPLHFLSLSLSTPQAYFFPKPTSLSQARFSRSPSVRTLVLPSISQTTLVTGCSTPIHLQQCPDAIRITTTPLTQSVSPDSKHFQLHKRSIPDIDQEMPNSQTANNNNETSPSNQNTNICTTHSPPTHQSANPKWECCRCRAQTPLRQTICRFQPCSHARCLYCQ